MNPSFAYEVFMQQINTIHYLDKVDGLSQIEIAKIVDSYPDIIKVYLDMFHVENNLVKVKRRGVTP